MAMAVIERPENAPAGQSEGVALVEDGEVQPIKTHQAVQRAQPKVSVARLRDGRDLVIWKALLGVPVVNSVGNRSRWEVRGGGGSGHQRPETKPGQRQHRTDFRHLPLFRL